MKKIGIITYHSAYNYGSVLQAYATQKMVNKIAGDSEIVNYRMKEQKAFYSLYRTKYGVKTLITDLLQLPVHKKRKRRAEKFEKFINNELKLTAEIEEADEISSVWSDVNTMISGSDQIWNKHSCELEHNDWKYMNPYLLDGFEGKKISYASSIANMSKTDLEHIKDSLKKFNSLSVRENSSKDILKELTQMDVEQVCDPTFLLSAEEWINALSLKENEEKYIFFYSLGGIKKYIKAIRALVPVAKRMNCKLKILTPFSYLPCFAACVENCSDYGPVDFMNAILNAQYVVTDSYHGTILSLNLKKQVYSICENKGAEFRKTDILEMLNLKNRIIDDVNDINNIELNDIDYDTVSKQIEQIRNKGINYITNAING